MHDWRVKLLIACMQSRLLQGEYKCGRGQQRTAPRRHLPRLWTTCCAQPVAWHQQHQSFQHCAERSPPASSASNCNSYGPGVCFAQDASRATKCMDCAAFAPRAWHGRQPLHGLVVYGLVEPGMPGHPAVHDRSSWPMCSLAHLVKQCGMQSGCRCYKPATQGTSI